MDPFSLATGALTIVSLVGSALKSAENLRNALKADDQVYALINQLTDLNCVLTSVNVSDKRFSEGQACQIGRVFERTTAKIAELEYILDHRLLKWKSRGSVLTVDRIAWLREKGKVESIQKELRSLTSTLTLTLMASTTGTVQRIELAVVDMMTDIRHSGRAECPSRATVDGNLSCLDQVDELLRVQHQELLSLLTPQSSTSGKATAQAQFRLTDDVTEQPNGCNFPISSDRPSQFASGYTRIRTTLLPKIESCSSSCGCRCHLTQWLETPRKLRNVLGLAFLGYSGLPASLQPCNIQSCRRHKQKFSAQFTWYFPSWFVHLVLIAFFSMSSASGPELLLRIPCVIPPTSPIFAYVQSNNVQGIKSLFANRLASPNDVSSVQGFTPLHVSVKKAPPCEYAYRNRSQSMRKETGQM